MSCPGRGILVSNVCLTITVRESYFKSCKPGRCIADVLPVKTMVPICRFRFRFESLPSNSVNRLRFTHPLEKTQDSGTIREFGIFYSRTRAWGFFSSLTPETMDTTIYLAARPIHSRKHCRVVRSCNTVIFAHSCT